VRPRSPPGAHRRGQGSGLRPSPAPGLSAATRGATRTRSQRARSRWHTGSASALRERSAPTTRPPRWRQARPLFSAFDVSALRLTITHIDSDGTKLFFEAPPVMPRTKGPEARPLW
jgi:hypothetical protein